MIPFYIQMQIWDYSLQTRLDNLYMRYGNISISIYLSFYLVNEKDIQEFPLQMCLLFTAALTLSSLDDICSHQGTAEQVMQCCMLQSWPEMEFKIWTFPLVTAILNAMTRLSVNIS